MELISPLILTNAPCIYNINMITELLIYLICSPHVRDLIHMNIFRGVATSLVLFVECQLIQVQLCDKILPPPLRVPFHEELVTLELSNKFQKGIME